MRQGLASTADMTQVGSSALIQTLMFSDPQHRVEVGLIECLANKTRMPWTCHFRCTISCSLLRMAAALMILLMKKTTGVVIAT